MVLLPFCFCFSHSVSKTAPQQFAGQPQFASAPAVMVGGPPMVAGGAPVPLMAGVAPNAYYAPIVVTMMPGKPPRGRVVHPEWNPAMDASRFLYFPCFFPPPFFLKKKQDCVPL